MSVGYVSEVFSSFQGEGLFAGRRHVFLRMAGCNLRCVYCDTPDSLERTEECAVYRRGGAEERLRNPLGTAEVAAVLRSFFDSQPGLHALAITGGEPLLQADFLAELLATAPPPLPVLLETNATFADRLRQLLPLVQIISADVKLPSNSGEPPLWDEHRAFLAASRDKIVYVKVPVDESTREEELREAAKLVAEANAATAFFLQPIAAPTSRLRISAERLERFYEIAVEHLEDVRILPQTHKILGVR